MVRALWLYCCIIGYYEYIDALSMQSCYAITQNSQLKMSRDIRKLLRVFTPNPQGEGDGAEVRRIIGSRELRNLDPFLMMDHFEVHKPHGFPDHPHRGFETVTYMIEGMCKHEDFKGHSGEIGPGDTQWMTAGRGIIHAEMPGSDVMTGLQLWVNLKATDKMCEPAYQEKTNNLLAKASKNGIDVTIIAGQSLGAKSETVTRTPTMYLDFKMQQGAVLEQNVESGWNAYMYVLSGRVKVENTEVRANQAGVFEKNGTVFIISALEATRFVLLAGRPIGEKIVQYGPFVMNEDHEINQAMRDYSMGVNGFEGSRTWQSRIASE